MCIQLAALNLRDEWDDFIWLGILPGRHARVQECEETGAEKVS